MDGKEVGGGAVGIDNRSEEMRWESKSLQVRAQIGAPAKWGELGHCTISVGVKQELLESKKKKELVEPNLLNIK